MSNYAYGKIFSPYFQFLKFLKLFRCVEAALNKIYKHSLFDTSNIDLLLSYLHQTYHLMLLIMDSSNTKIFARLLFSVSDNKHPDSYSLPALR